MLRRPPATTAPTRRGPDWWPSPTVGPARTTRQRQGIASALADGLDPLNVLAWEPHQGRYSPLWDVHLTEWTPAAKAAGRDLRQSRFADVEDLARAGLVTAPGGGAWGASDVVVLCPIISQG